MTAAKAGATSNGRKLVSLDELTALPLPTEDVELPEQGVWVTLHAILGTERQRIAEAHKKDADVGDRLNLQHEVIAATLDTTPEKIAVLPAVAIDRLSKVALRLTGFAPDQVDEAVKELGPTPSVASG